MTKDKIVKNDGMPPLCRHRESHLVLQVSRHARSFSNHFRLYEQVHVISIYTACHYNSLIMNVLLFIETFAGAFSIFLAFLEQKCNRVDVDFVIHFHQFRRCFCCWWPAQPS